MSELLPRDSRFCADPNRNMYMTPSDPYSDRALQFMALKHLGYPVDLVPVPSSKLPAPYHPDENDHLAFRYNKWKTWLMPVVHDPAFEEYIEDPDVVGDRTWTDNETMQDFMGSHYMSIASEIEGAHTSMLGYYVLSRLEGTGPASLHDKEGNVPSLNILGPAFMAGYQRGREVVEAGYKLHNFQEIGTREHLLYEQLTSIGVTAINPEQVGGLVLDYYLLAESVDATFASFKK